MTMIPGNPIRKIPILALVIITTFSIFASHLVSGYQAATDKMEYLGDFEYPGFEKFQKNDIGEDGDSIFSTLPEFMISCTEIMIGADLKLNFTHVIQDVTSPPPETV